MSTEAWLANVVCRVHRRGGSRYANGPRRSPDGSLGLSKAAPALHRAELGRRPLDTRKLFCAPRGGTPPRWASHRATALKVATSLRRARPAQRPDGTQPTKAKQNIPVRRG